MTVELSRRSILTLLGLGSLATILPVTAARAMAERGRAIAANEGDETAIAGVAQAQGLWVAARIVYGRAILTQLDDLGDGHLQFGEPLYALPEEFAVGAIQANMHGDGFHVIGGTWYPWQRRSFENYGMDIPDAVRESLSEAELALLEQTLQWSLDQPSEGVGWGLRASAYAWRPGSDAAILELPSMQFRYELAMSDISETGLMLIGASQDWSTPYVDSFTLLNINNPDEPVSRLLSEAGESTQCLAARSGDAVFAAASVDPGISPAVSIFDLDPTRVKVPAIEADLIAATQDDKVAGVLASRNGQALLWTSGSADQWRSAKLDVSGLRSLHGLMGADAGFVGIENDGTITVHRLGDMLP